MTPPKKPKSTCVSNDTCIARMDKCARDRAAIEAKETKTKRFWITLVSLVSIAFFGWQSVSIVTLLARTARIDERTRPRAGVLRPSDSLATSFSTSERIDP